MADEEELLGKACDNPDVIKAGGRYSPGLEGHFPGDQTEGMCTSVHCNFEDVEAWRISANRFMNRLADLTDLLEKRAKEFYAEEEEPIPDEIKELIAQSDSVVSDWKVSYEDYAPQKVKDYILEYGEYIIGYWFIHAKTKPIVEEIIAKFREAACLFDAVNLTYESLGGKAATVPGAGLLTYAGGLPRGL